MTSRSLPGLNFGIGSANFNPTAAAENPQPNNGADVDYNSAFNLVNPVFVAAWKSMMDGMIRGNADPMSLLHQNKNNPPGSGHGDGGSDWRNSTEGGHWNLK